MPFIEKIKHILLKKLIYCDIIYNHGGYMYTKNTEELIEYLKNYKLEYKDQIGGLDLPFGCEIEFENVSQELIRRKLSILFAKQNISNWHLESDSSLNDYKNKDYNRNIYGGEVISPVLWDRKEDWMQLKQICELLKDNNAKNLGKSAAHIHFDSTIFKDYDQIIRILKLWCVYEDVIYRFSSGFDEHLRPVVQQYAMPCGNKFRSLINSVYAADYEKLKRNLKIAKTYGISFFHMDEYNKDTIEIRTPNGTLDEAVWQNNVNFFKHLLTSTLSEQKDWDLIDHYINSYDYSYYQFKNYENLNIQKAIELCDFIFEEEKDKFNFIKQYVKQ